MTDKEKKELEAWKKRKMEEAMEIRKEFPTLSALYIYATFISCRFNPNETRKALKEQRPITIK